MSTSWIFNTIVGAVLLPPLSLILLCALGMALARRRPRLGHGLSIVALLLLTILSTEAGALLLAQPLEERAPPLLSARAQQAQAIVVLGGGRMANAPEYGGEDVSGLVTLGRLRYGARLQRETALPLLVSGGAPDGRAQGEAVLMANALREDFGVSVKWIEDRSDDTAQNARFSAQLLRQANVRRILLVTDALHMARAQRVFEHQGLEVVAAPTVFYSRTAVTPMRWVPSAGALRLSHYALHEWIGLVWYELRQY